MGGSMDGWMDGWMGCPVFAGLRDALHNTSSDRAFARDIEHGCFDHAAPHPMPSTY